LKRDFLKLCDHFHSFGPLFSLQKLCWYGFDYFVKFPANFLTRVLLVLNWFLTLDFAFAVLLFSIKNLSAFLKIFVTNIITLTVCVISSYWLLFILKFLMFEILDRLKVFNSGNFIPFSAIFLFVLCIVFGLPIPFVPLSDYSFYVLLIKGEISFLWLFITLVF